MCAQGDLACVLSWLIGAVLRVVGVELAIIFLIEITGLALIVAVLAMVLKAVRGGRPS